MRSIRFALVASLSLTLGGCFGLTLPPKPLPEWAMNPQGEPSAPRRARPVAHVPASRTPDRTAAVSYITPNGVRPTNEPPADVKPFSPEWQAREDAFDNKLRRTMTICRGC